MRRFTRWRRPPHGLGVDFGYSGVKAVALAADGEDLTLVGAGRERLDPGVVRDGAVQDAEAVGSALGRLLTRLRIRGRLAALALGGSSVFIKRFPAPPDRAVAGAPEDFRDAVAREAARHLPLHLESLEFDYERPLPPPREPGASQPGAIVFGAAPREVVQNHCGGVRAAGREVSGIDLEPYALFAAARLIASRAAPDPPSGGLVIAEIGASRAGVHVFGRWPRPRPRAGTGGPAASRDLNAGAEPDLRVSVPATEGTAFASDRLQATEDVRFGPAGQGEDAEVLGNRIAATIREALREAELPGPARLCLSGGGASDPVLLRGFRELDLGEPLVLDPLASIGGGQGGPAFAVAAGLAYQAALDLQAPETGRRS